MNRLALLLLVAAIGVFAYGTVWAQRSRPEPGNLPSERREGVAEKDKTIAFENNKSAPADVYINFGADSVVNASTLGAFCDSKSTPPLNCHFVLAKNSSVDLPNPGNRYVNLAAALNAPVTCGSTKAEVIANNPVWFDIVDVSVVDGFNEKIEIDVKGSDGSTQILGPPNGKTGNQKIFGVFPFGCTICAGVKNPPCGSLGQNECHAGTESDPKPPCQYQINAPDGTIKVILQP